MKTLLAIMLVCLSSVGPLTRDARADGVCPTNAVFLAVADQIRGYPLRANGRTVPCQVIQGPNTQLGTARAIAFSVHNNLHVVQFLTNGTADIFFPSANGDAAPSRIIETDTNDLTAIAVDSKLNDYLISIRGAQPPLFAVPNGTSRYVGNFIPIADSFLAEYEAIAVDRRDRLTIAGLDQQGLARVDTFDVSARLVAPPLLRSLHGPSTGLFPGTIHYADNSMSLAVDPATSELYVYGISADQSTVQVSVFAANATGNTAPTRVIRGPATGITGPGFVGTSKIAVSSDGRLFVAEPNDVILVFAPGSSGNVAPSQVIQDATIGSAQVDQGGVAVRACPMLCD